MVEERSEPAGLAPIASRGEDCRLRSGFQYDRLRGIPSGAVNAVTFGMESLGRSLRLAREEAGLTQAELAKRLRRSQAMVSSAETGTVRIGQRYVAAVLRACKLPEDWKPSRRR